MDTTYQPTTSNAIANETTIYEGETTPLTNVRLAKENTMDETTKTDRSYTFAVTVEDGQWNVTYFAATEDEAKREAAADWPEARRISRIG